MAKLKIMFDPIGNTMNIWWGDQTLAHKSVEVEDQNRNDILILDEDGNPIGIELIGLLPSELNISKITAKYNLTNNNEPITLTS